MLYEHFSLFSAGDSTSIKDSTKVTKNFENNQKINRSMMVESVTKLVNNVTQDVMQKNTATAAAAAGASNTLMLSGINCNEITISGIDQNSEANVDVLVKSQQANTSKISTEISTSIDKTIEKVGATDLAALQAENTKQLNDFMNAMPGYDPNKAQKMASQCPEGGSLFSAGNSCDVSSEYELNSSVKQALELDESFKINDKDDISNDIIYGNINTEISNFRSIIDLMNILPYNYPNTYKNENILDIHKSYDDNIDYDTLKIKNLEHSKQKLKFNGNNASVKSLNPISKTWLEQTRHLVPLPIR